MDNPFRTKYWQDTIKKDNVLTRSEFCKETISDINGVYVRLDEINDMIAEGVLLVDYDKLEKVLLTTSIQSSGGTLWH